MKLIATVALAIVAVAEGRLSFSSKYTVADKVYVNDKLVAEGNSVEGAVGCHASPEKTHDTFKVCGCNVKVVANLRQECKAYGKYSQEVGHCDCGKDTCDEVKLESGYTDKFTWHAGSYEIKSCK